MRIGQLLENMMGGESLVDLMWKSLDEKPHKKPKATKSSNSLGKRSPAAMAVAKKKKKSK